MVANVKIVETNIYTYKPLQISVMSSSPDAKSLARVSRCFSGFRLRKRPSKDKIGHNRRNSYQQAARKKVRP